MVVSFSSKEGLAARRFARSRIVLTTTARPTLLLSIACLSYLNVVRGRQVPLGKWSWVVWVPALGLWAGGASLTALAPQDSRAVWIALATWLTIITSLSKSGDHYLDGEIRADCDCLRSSRQFRQVAACDPPRATTKHVGPAQSAALVKLLTGVSSKQTSKHVKLVHFLCSLDREVNFDPQFTALANPRTAKSPLGCGL